MKMDHDTCCLKSTALYRKSKNFPMAVKALRLLQPFSLAPLLSLPLSAQHVASG